MTRRKKKLPHLWFEISGNLRAHVTKAVQNPLPQARHHRVPVFYLRSWTDGSARLRRTDLDAGASQLVSPRDVGVGRNFYSIDGANTPDHRDTVEHIYSYIENAAAPVLARLRPQWILEPDELEVLNLFMAAQLTRGMKFRRTLLGISDFAMAVGLKAGDEIEVDLTHEYDMPKFDQVAFAMRRMDIEYGGFKGRSLVALQTAPHLLTTDEPVVPIDQDLGSFTAQVGVEDAPIVIFPVRPNLLLVSFHSGWPLSSSAPLSVDETNQVNRAVLGNAFRESYERPETSIALSTSTPPLRGTRIRVTGELPNGGLQIRTTDPGRWTGYAGAPRHVIPRWWVKPAPTYRTSALFRRPDGPNPK